LPETEILLFLGDAVQMTALREPYMNKQKKIPDFKSEADERIFWEDQDSTDYLDWGQARPASFPNLKLSTTTISLRLPVGLLDRIKIEANKRDVPYQSLIKAWLAEDVNTRGKTK